MANIRKASITIDHTLIGSSLTDFPVLLTRACLADEICDPSSGDSARADGGDIRFYTDEAGTTEIAREIVAFERDTGTGAGDASVEIWVLVPSVSSSVDQVVWVQYGDGSLTEPAASSTYGSEAVWGDYISIHHCSDTSDSTGNGHTLSLAGSPSVVGTGLTAGAYSLNGSSQYAYASHSTAYNLNRNYTIQILLKSDAASGTQGPSGIIDKSPDNHDGYKLIYTTSTGWRMRQPDFSSANLNGADTFAAGENLFMVSTMDGTTRRIFQNGTSLASDTPSGTVGNNIGAVTFGYHQAFTSEKWSGLIDEIRIRNTALGADSIGAEHSNQSNPASFAVMGTPSAIGGGTLVPLLQKNRGLTGHMATMSGGMTT